jgi:alkylation response protein AidB-like acyl-CoA dehydrogenase
MSHTDSSTLNFHLSEEVQAIKDVAASFADNEIAPHVLHFDETQEFWEFWFQQNMVVVDLAIRNIPSLWKK